MQAIFACYGDFQFHIAMIFPWISKYSAERKAPIIPSGYTKAKNSLQITQHVFIF